MEGAAGGAVAGGGLVYATNSNAPAPGMVQQRLALGALPTRRGGSNTVHAELKIYGANVGVPYIGTSKRGCRLCELALWVVGGPAHRGCHGELFDEWGLPDFISNNAVHLTSFLGFKADLIYQNLSEEGQRQARSLICNNLKQCDG